MCKQYGLKNTNGRKNIYDIISTNNIKITGLTLGMCAECVYEYVWFCMSDITTQLFKKFSYNDQIYNISCIRQGIFPAETKNVVSKC